MTRIRVWPAPALALLALALAVPVAARPAQPAQPPAAKPAGAAVPADAFFFASVRVSKLWDNPAAKPLRDWVASQKGGTTERLLGLPPADLDRVTLFAATANPADGGAPVMMVTARQKCDEAKVLKRLGGKLPDGARATPDRALAIDSAFPWLVFLDDRTLLYLPRPLDDRSVGPDLLARLKARKADGPLAGALALAADHDLVVGLDVRRLSALVAESGWDKGERIAPLLGLLKAKTATLTADFDKTAKVRFALTFADADAAKPAAPVLEEAIKTLTGHLDRKPDPFAELFDPAEQKLTEWAVRALKGAKVAAAGADVVATADVPFADDLTKLVAVLPKQLLARRDERPAINNLKQLALAMHNYESAFGQFPSDVMPTGDKPLAMSWRVQILPFVEQNPLYQKLDTTKPWDDPANLKVLEDAPMPKVFEFPGRPAPKGHTYFRVFMMPKDAKGTDRPWLKEGQRGPKIADILDGTSNTFMIVEAEEAVPWYKPDVLAYDGKLPLPGLGDPTTGRFLAAMGDGSVRAFRPVVLGEKTVRAMITIGGGEVIEMP